MHRKIALAALLMAATGLVGCGPEKAPAAAGSASSTPRCTQEPTGGPPPVIPPRPEAPSPVTPGVKQARVGLPAAAAPQAGLKPYVALGDSFSAGEGAPQYGSGCFDSETDVAGNHCHRSQEAYPVKVWRTLPGYSLTTVACSGAIVDDYFTANPKNDGEPPQRNAFARVNPKRGEQRPAGVPPEGLDPGLVTVTMGGNDGGFAQVLLRCAVEIAKVPLDVVSSWLQDQLPNLSCNLRVDKAFTDVDHLTDIGSDPPRPGGRTGHKLADFYRSLRADAPNATILVLGYPQFFPDAPSSDCSTGIALGYFTRAQMKRINDIVQLANLQIHRLADAAGLGYVDVQDVETSADATLCQDDPRLRRQNRFIYSDWNRSFHPTIAAHDEEARRVVECLRTMACNGAPVPAATNRLTAVDWVAFAGTSLRCDSEPEVQKETVLHDVTGDGVPDSFVFLDCYTGDDRYPASVQVYDGASDPAAPRQLGVLADDLYFWRSGCLTFDGASVTMHAHDYRSGDPAGTPSLIVRQTSTWNGTSFTAQARTVLPVPADGLVPGC